MEQLRKTLAREIEAVENLIRLLNECLAISTDNERKDEVKLIGMDLKLCQDELEKLLIRRKSIMEMDAERDAVV